MADTQEIQPADQAGSAGGADGSGPNPRFALRNKVKSGEGRLAARLIAPAVILMLAVIGYPVVTAVWSSLHLDKADAGLNPQGFFEVGGKWVGFKYYTYWFHCGSTCVPGTTGHDFYPAIGQTLLFTGATVFFEVILGMIFALMMNGTYKGRGLVRAVILVPWAIPTAVTAQLWKFMFDYQGILNKVLHTNIVWLGNTGTARAAVVIADVWKTTPFIALLLLAGLQVIPADIYESARVDGATAWQRFRQITLPLVKPALLVAVLFRILDVLRIYDLPQILTGGANGTTTLSILVVRELRSSPNNASALSTITFVLIFVVAFLLVKVMGVNVVQTEARGAKK
ncbi:MAG: ABC-type sugar transport system, permease component [Frankiales bacterium]|nr:ABC-type sugar transport system, permease component [Frankiales bacterium]